MRSISLINLRSFEALGAAGTVGTGYRQTRVVSGLIEHDVLVSKSSRAPLRLSTVSAELYRRRVAPPGAGFCVRSH